MAAGTNLLITLVPEYNNITTGAAWAYGALSANPPSVIKLPVTNFNVNVDQRKISSKALMGNRFVNIISNGDHAISGSFTFEVTPDTFGPIAFMIMGAEANASTVSTGVYAHAFSPVTGADNSLKSFSLQADYGVDSKPITFLGCKVDNVTFAVDQDNYLTCTVNIKGQTYDLDESNVTATLTPVLKPYTFKGGTISFGTAGSTAATAIVDAMSFAPTYSNNLEDMRQRMDGNPYGQEPDYQLGEFTADIECDYTDATSAYRVTNFLGGTEISVQALFTHEANPTTSTTANYEMKFDIPYAQIMNAPLNIGGPEREKMTFSIRAIQNNTTTGAVILTLQDGYDGLYSTGDGE